MVDQGYDGIRQSNVQLPTDGLITLRMFIDASSLEVFLNEGEVVMSARIFPQWDHRETWVFAGDGEGSIRELTCYELQPVWSSMNKETVQ